jgi:lipoprotein signal peptidase
MARRRGLAALLAAGVVVSTVAVDLLRETTSRHERSVAVLVLAGAIAAALLVLAPRLNSLLVTIGTGLAAGGALATLVAGAAWGGGVPDPLVGGEIAFNVADAAIALGELLLVGGALAFAWRNRTRLGEPV